ncbi:MAG: glutamate racemase [Clostridium sp.]|nr:glutamate racemase [Clostridium sp.]
MNENLPIGFFDSGLGGISVLKEAIKLLPNENYIYYGDSKNAPYGVRPLEEVVELSLKSIEYLVDQGVKAVVVACNTATSAAIIAARDKYTDLPIIGIEPALKLAADSGDSGKILVLATERTLAEEKFNSLFNKFNKGRTIIKKSLPELVNIVEAGEVKEKSYDYLKEELKDTPRDLESIVLGCTHYPFAKKEISAVLGEDIPIFDGSFGVSKRLKSILTQQNMLNKSNKKGSIEFRNSLNSKEIINLSYKLLNLK